jgi:hypothetical protein
MRSVVRGQNFISYYATVLEQLLNGIAMGSSYALTGVIKGFVWPATSSPRRARGLSLSKAVESDLSFVI